MPPVAQENRLINQLCLKTGQLLLRHGAECALVESVTRRFGHALGVDKVEVAILANALIITTSAGSDVQTATIRNLDLGVNMHVVVEVQRLLFQIEETPTTVSAASAKLDEIVPLHHSFWAIVLMIGLSCACFARLTQSDWIGCVVTFIASAAAMGVRYWLSRLGFSALVNFWVTAFVATSLAAQALIYHWGSTPKIAMAASCLLLVPGVPLINGVSDLVKGYVNVGISRWMFATLLSLSTCGGIISAMTVWNVWGWL